MHFTLSDKHHYLLVEYLAGDTVSMHVPTSEFHVSAAPLSKHVLRCVKVFELNGAVSSFILMTSQL